MPSKRFVLITVLLTITVSLVPSACATSGRGDGLGLYGTYRFQFEGLFDGYGRFSVTEMEGKCLGWADWPSSGPGVEVVRCEASGKEVSLVLRVNDSSGREIFVRSKAEGRELHGSWSTVGNRGRFLARREGF